MITSGSLDKTALELREANAVPTFGPISTALQGFLKNLLPYSLILLVLFLLRFLKNTPKPSASLALSLTVIDLILLQIEQRPISFLLSLEVISLQTIDVADRCLPPTQ